MAIAPVAGQLRRESAEKEKSCSPFISGAVGAETSSGMGTRSLKLDA